MARIHDVAAEFRERLLAEEDRAVRAIVRAYSVAQSAITRELIRLLLDMDEAGPSSPASWLLSSGRLEALLAQVSREVSDWAGLTGRFVASGQSEAVAQAAAAAPLYYEARKTSAVVLGEFDRLPIEALQQFVGRASDGSPLEAVFAQYGRRGAEVVEDTLIEAIALGQNPREAARVLERRLGDPDIGLPSPFDETEKGLSRLKNRALTTARQEIVSAHRSAGMASYRANADVVPGWVWLATLDTRTCPVCWAMHGTKFGHGEEFGSHVQCRCTAVPDFEGAEPIETGEIEFGRLSREEQEAVLGPVKLELYEAGKPLRTFVYEYEDPKWGKQRVERTSKNLVRG